MKSSRRVEKRAHSPVIPLPPRSEAVESRRPPPAAPAWPALIVIVLVGISLLALTDVLTPEGAWRAVTDSLTVALMFIAVAGWARANRPALAGAQERAVEGAPLEIRHVASQPHPRWPAEPKGRRRERTRVGKIDPWVL